MLLAHRASQQPHLSGTVRLLNGVHTADGQTLVELDAFRRDSLRLGHPPADIPIPNTTAQITLSLGRAFGDIHEILVKSSSGTPLLDGVPLTQERRLLDTAVLDIGGVQLRYENLRLRQAQREQTQQVTNQQSYLHQ